ncbi:efflux RND transporter periplasmic adaptor subunit [Porticoccus sp. GXU_MW_L64]
MKRLLPALISLVVGLGAGYYLFQPHDDNGNGTPEADHQHDHASHWTCPMHPKIVRDEPGSCPICGMDLVLKKQSAQAEDDASTITIFAAVENNLGVKTEPAVESLLSRRIETVGYVQFNESSLHHIHSRVEGWIETLNVESVGDPIKKGQVLFEIYAPELVNAQEEYITALASGNKKLLSASRLRLELLGVTESQIDKLRSTRKISQRLAVLAHRDGYVSALNVRHGMHVKPATEIMATGDLNTVWVIGEVFERQAAWLKESQQVTMRADSYPGHQWMGEVEYIYPVLNETSRTVQVRVRFDNADELLKPNMFASLTIHADSDKPLLNIPRQALIRGGHVDRVVLSEGEGRYRSVPVLAGMESGDRVAILDGLTVDDQVVTSAQFMIDSESNLDADLDRLHDAADVSDSRGLWVTGGEVLRRNGYDAVIRHNAIPEWKWPAMTMTYGIGRDVDVSQLIPGAQLEFRLYRKRKGLYLITRVEVKNPQAGGDRDD